MSHLDLVVSRDQACTPNAKSSSSGRLLDLVHLGLYVLGREAVHELDGFGDLLGILCRGGGLANVDLHSKARGSVRVGRK